MIVRSRTGARSTRRSPGRRREAASRGRRPRRHRKPEQLRTAPGPDPRRLAAAGVVVVQPARDLLLVVGLLAQRQLRHAQHLDSHPGRASRPRRRCTKVPEQMRVLQTSNTRIPHTPTSCAQNAAFRSSGPAAGVRRNPCSSPVFAENLGGSQTPATSSTSWGSLVRAQYRPFTDRVQQCGVEPQAIPWCASSEPRPLRRSRAVGGARDPPMLLPRHVCRVEGRSRAWAFVVAGGFVRSGARRFTRSGVDWRCSAAPRSALRGAVSPAPGLRLAGNPRGVSMRDALSEGGQYAATRLVHCRAPSPRRLARDRFGFGARGSAAREAGDVRPRGPGRTRSPRPPRGSSCSTSNRRRQGRGPRPC